MTAHMLSPEDHARYCFEMARLYAELGDEANMLRYLTKASEGGFDVMSEMRSDAKLDSLSQRCARDTAGSECKGAAERTRFDRYCARQGAPVAADSAELIPPDDYL